MLLFRNVILQHCNTLLNAHRHLPSQKFDNFKACYTLCAGHVPNSDTLLAGWLLTVKNTVMDNLRISPEGLQILGAIVVCYRYRLAINSGVSGALILKLIEQDLNHLTELNDGERGYVEILRGVVYNCDMNSISGPTFITAFNTAYSATIGPLDTAQPWGTVDNQYQHKYRLSKEFIEAYYTALLTELKMIPALLHALACVKQASLVWRKV